MGEQKKIRLGISACLLGEHMRYDAGHKLDRFLRDTLGQFVEYVPVCPEVECGLSVPREPMHLEGDPADPRLVTIRTRVDHTDRMKRWATQRLQELEAAGLVGFIFKSKSPSSGMERVGVYDEEGVPHQTGVGLWARALMDRFPLLPVEDESRLHDPAIRENFIERVFVLQRFREAAAVGTRGALVEFHTRHKLLLLAHSPRHYTDLGRLVARAKQVRLPDLFAQYGAALMAALRLRATPAKHTNVLQHIMGYFRPYLSADEKQELLDLIAAHRRGHVPLIVPVTLLNHYARKYDEPYLRGQYYLNPHPLELQLRNHV